MFGGHDQAIFDLLAERGLVEPASLQTAFAECRGTGKALSALVLEVGLMDKPSLLRAVAGHIGCPYAEELPSTPPEGAPAVFAAGLARAYGAVPIAADVFSVTVAAIDPFNPDIASDLSFALERDVRIVVADPVQIQSFIGRHYGESGGRLDDPRDGLKPQAGGATGTSPLSETDIEQMAGHTPLIDFVNLVLAQAIRDKASDIHFEPFEHEFKIRCRIDGGLHEMPPPPRNLAWPIISRLKVLANLNIAERRLPQDGRIKLNLGGRAVDLRVSTLPTQFGESVVLRVLDRSAGQLELGQLGLPAAIQSGVEEIIRRPNGIFIVTGPTGSGKTTTLYSCLKILNTIDAKLLTIEDPVEYEIEGIMQVPVNMAAGLTFARALRTFLRQDPDIVMVGEIRDFETAQIAIQASLTGHLVLTTLHTNDAPSAVTRLADMGVEPFLIASTLEAVLAQRLVRRICPLCRVAFTPGEPLLRQLDIGPSTVKDQPFYAGRGCPACHGTGFQGRLGLFEFLPMNDVLRDLVGRGVSLVQLRHKAMEQCMTSLRDAGLQAVLAGETTVEEVVRYT